MRVNMVKLALAAGVSAAALTGCASTPSTGNRLPAATFVGSDDIAGEKYIIGPLDSLNIFVWRNTDLGGKVQVRPDGMITTPLISDLQAAGKTPAELAEDLRLALTQYVEDPRVSVMVDSFQGTFGQQIRIVGATAKPASLPYRANMTLLDAMIEVGGLSEYAAGDRARLIRHDKASGAQKEYDLKIARLLKKGDTGANVRLEPGDVIIIPESMF
ncbi:XrtA/PEP-CTERM system exopolysaccharide export protein [Allosphingosinicella deserti]|uniref:Polysaccharide export protein n=1 Tax=Allosphingosinicella deserti TaxID=2116704 RepID=A0A2P7QPZ9_9SPHN|nr:XrtA/PEP-CTERM system exopolysaccharide export protein [Sphingomonas deserti]PSJ40014.1 polysaccharide export protein [Sphingomonas deserti]